MVGMCKRHISYGILAMVEADGAAGTVLRHSAAVRYCGTVAEEGAKGLEVLRLSERASRVIVGAF